VTQEETKFLHIWGLAGHAAQEQGGPKTSGIENPESRIETKRNEGKQAQDKHSWLLFHFGLLLSALRPKNR